MKRVLRQVIAVLLPALALLWLIWPLRSGAPESTDLRAYLREPPLPLGPNAWRATAEMPEHLFGRALYQALLRTGCDFPTLALLSPLTALAALWLWSKLSAQSRRVRPLVLLTLAALVLSPAFGGNWLLVERGRVLAPVVALLAMVLLLAKAGVWRFGAAMLVSLSAIGTHETGSLMWLAVLPLLTSSVPRAALWLLIHNAALVVCYDETSRPSASGLARSLLEAPQQTLELVARMLTGALPDLAPASAHDQLLGAGVLVLAMLGAAVAVWRGDAAARPRRAMALCVALGGLLQALTLAHIHAPLGITQSILREVAWGTWLLPVGTIAVWADLLPRLARRTAPVACGALLVLLAQDWQRGAGHLESVARVLRQTEALLVFVDLGPAAVPFMPQPAVVEPTQRAWLRRRGLLQRASPAQATLAGIATSDGSAGVMLPPEARQVHGAVVRTHADLVLLVRQSPQGPPRLAKVVAPDTLEAGANAAWRDSLADAEQFGDGETLRAFAFDLRTRAMRPLNGVFVWRDGTFVAEGR